MTPRKSPPKKDAIARLEPYAGLELEQIFVVTNERQAGIAFDELSNAGNVGFDTESKPTFRKGQKSEGPHVLQFATTEKAFIFQSHVAESREAIIGLLKSEKLTKIGFDLRGDLTQISDRFGIRPESLVDLDRSFKKLGYRNSIGAKTAIALLFNRRFLKSKSVTTSNWEAKWLTDRQLLYAANDAFAAIQVFHALENGEL
jgi:ribonuclease D